MATPAKPGDSLTHQLIQPAPHAAARLRAQGVGWKKIAVKLGIGVGKAIRIAQEDS